VWYRYIDDAITYKEFDTLAEAEAFDVFRSEMIAITEIVKDLGGS